MSKTTILVTGAAGFIGYHVARELLEAGREVVGLDNLNAYYDPALKQARLALLLAVPRLHIRSAAISPTGRRPRPCSPNGDSRW